MVLSSRYQDVFALLVRSCSLTSLEQVVITLLYKVDDGNRLAITRLIQVVRNKLLRACCHQQLVMMISDILVQLVASLLA